MVRNTLEKFTLAAQEMAVVILITAVGLLVLVIFLGYQWIDRGVDTRPTASELSTARDKRMAQYMLKNMIYFKDDRTGLCFATTIANDHTLACVPCEKVEHLLVPQSEPEQ